MESSTSSASEFTAGSKESGASSSSTSTKISANVAAAKDVAPTRPPVYLLNEDNELRIEVADEAGAAAGVIIEVIEGSAEIFGTQLSVHKRYALPPATRAAIFTYRGAKIEVVGKTESAYIAQQTPMIMYLNTHAALESMRAKVEEEMARNTFTKAQGPRLMVTGPVDVGKSTLCRILANYAVRQGRAVMFVDLDVGQRTISVPGSIGALFVERPADIVDGFAQDAAFVYNFGDLSPSANIVLYDMLVRQLAEQVTRHAESQRASRIGGVIINTCGWIKGDGYDSIVKAADAFKVDVVIVLDHERLYNELQRDLPSFIKILHLPKSGGVETRSIEQRRQFRVASIHKYFYGTKLTPFFPRSIEIPYGERSREEQELLVYKIGAEQLPDSCLPYGMVIEDHRTMIVPMPINAQLCNHVLALMPADVSVDQTLLTRPCLGFLVVTAVDTVAKTLTLLSPQPYPLPSRIALFSNVTFTDDTRVG